MLDYRDTISISTMRKSGKKARTTAGRNKHLFENSNTKRKPTKVGSKET